MATIFKTTFSNAFSGMKINKYRSRFHWIFPRVQLNNSPALVQIMARHRPGDKPLSEPLSTDAYMHNSASISSGPFDVCSRTLWINTLLCAMNIWAQFPLSTMLNGYSLHLKSVWHTSSNLVCSGNRLMGHYLIGHIQPIHYSDVIISATASEVTTVSIVCSTVCSETDQRIQQSSAPLAFMKGIHRWQVYSPHKRPVARKSLSFHDVIMINVIWKGTSLAVYSSNMTLTQEFKTL